MEPQTLTAKPRNRDNYRYIIEVAQRDRICPAKYRNKITIPLSLYDKLSSAGVIEVEFYLAEEAAFFNFRKEEVTISFLNVSHCNDLQLRIYHFLIVREIGFDPIKRHAVSKMSIDTENEN